MNINENFMLVCCIEQDIQSIILFDVFEQAFDKMCEQFGDVWNMTVKDVKEKYCNIHEDEYNCDNSFIGNYFDLQSVMVIIIIGKFSVYRI